MAHFLARSGLVGRSSRSAFWLYVTGLVAVLSILPGIDALTGLSDFVPYRQGVALAGLAGLVCQMVARLADAGIRRDAVLVPLLPLALALLYPPLAERLGNDPAQTIAIVGANMTLFCLCALILGLLPEAQGEDSATTVTI